MAYNIQPQWYYRQQKGAAPSRRPPPQSAAPSPPARETNGGSHAAPANKAAPRRQSAARRSPIDIGDPGDILLLTVLLFLYLESRDPDFLIILIVVGFSVLRHDGEDG